MKIAIYSPNWVGDATLALPFIHQLKDQYPDSKIVIVCKDWVESVFINNPNINDVITLSKKDLRGIVSTIRTGMFLRQHEFDYFYTLTDSFRSAFIMWLSDTAIRIGYKSQARSFLISKPTSKPIDIKYRPDKYLKLISGKEIDHEEKYIYLNQDEVNWAIEKMLEKGISEPIALFPFSVSSSRTLPDNKIKEWFSNSKEQYVIFGSKSDERKAEEMIAKNKNISMQSFCGKYDLRKSVALISVCNYAFATDSGLGHISSALGIPTVSFFGAGRASVTKPIGKYNVVIDKSNRCKPCKKNICCLNAIKKSDVNYAIKFLQIDSKLEVQ
tara:strand:+ start:204 stop:1187 length:984 start_codon:yes stop_codon:yes gene_type:complete